MTSDFLDRAERFEAVERTLFEHKAAIDAEDPVELAAALREIIRVGVEENLMSWANSIEWKAVGSAVLAASSAPEDHEEDLRMLQAGVLRLVRGVLPLYRDMARLGGLRLRSGATWEEFARVTSAALEGIARQPSAAPRIQTPMILGLALIESLVLFAFVIAFMLQGQL